MLKFTFMKLLKFIPLFIVILIFNLKLNAQITVTNNTIANDLVQRLIGTGVTVSNATLNCPSVASADFTTITSNLNLDSGIVLTSGTAATTALVGGVNSPGGFASTYSQTPGDVDLTNLSAQQTFDACVLEFDFSTIGDSVKFKYVFGSSEYPGWTCTNFNDVFGFFISGPGIAGPYTNGAKNIALVPGSPSCPVGVSTIYCPNNPGCCNTSNTNCFNLTPGCGAFNAVNNTCAYFVCNPAVTTVNYPGFTTVLIAESEVIPCSTYHMKLAISDAADGVLDSGVFLEAGSFSSNEVNVRLETGLSSANGNPYIIEGCDTAELVLSRKIVLGIANADTVQFLIQGNAQNGIDYNQLQDTVIFTNNINDTIRTIQLYAFQDLITEGTEFITLYVLGGCSQTITDSITIEVREQLDITLFNNDTAICLGNSINTSGYADSGIAISWSPAIDVQNPNVMNTIITPLSFGTQVYTVTGNYNSCPPVSKSFTVKTDPTPNINFLPDLEVCEGDSIQINAGVSPAFNYNILWTPSTDLINTNSYTPTFVGTTTQNISLTLTSPNAGCTTTDNFDVTVWPFLQGNVKPDTLVCDGTPIELWVTGGIGQYLWYPANTLSCDSCSNPISTAFGTQVYYVVLLEPHGCQDTLRTIVENHPPFTMTLWNNDTTIYMGDEVKLLATGAPFYGWTPSTYLSYTTSGDPTAIPLEDITYTVTGVSLFNGCPQTDSVRIKVIMQDVFVPNAFSPNGDGNNDFFKVIARKLIQVQEFNIYNRWGQVVFSTKDISRGWDGTFKGVPQDVGTYYYMMRVSYPTGRADFLKGDINLIR